MNDFHLNMLHIHVWNNEGRVTFDWRGRIVEREPGIELNPYLQNAIDETAGKEVVIDISALEYINSRAIPAIIFFMRGLDSMNTRTTLCYNSKSGWQSTMTQAIEVMARGMKNILLKGV